MCSTLMLGRFIIEGKASKFKMTRAVTLDGRNVVGGEVGAHCTFLR